MSEAPEKILIDRDTAAILCDKGVEVHMETQFYIMGEKATRTKKNHKPRRSPNDKLKLTDRDTMKQIVMTAEYTKLTAWLIGYMRERPILSSGMLGKLVADQFNMVAHDASYRVGRLIRYGVLVSA